MKCPDIKELPEPPPGMKGWPWDLNGEVWGPPKLNNGDWPRISIVTPSYNQGRFLEQSVRSVLLQNYPDLEYIIIDAGSNDESVEIIKKYEPWLTYWISEPDRGQSHAINKGLRKSTGQLFNWHNSDDNLTPNSLYRSALAILEHPNAGYAYGFAKLIDEHGREKLNEKPNTVLEIGYRPLLSRALSELKAGFQPGCLMKREFVEQAGGIDEELHYVMDFDIMLRIGLRNPPIYIPHPQVYFRKHPAVKSNQWNRHRATERIRIVNKIYKKPGWVSPVVKQNKRKAFRAAHKFAWMSYLKAENCFHLFMRHFVLDVYYSLGGGWKERLKLLIWLLIKKQRWRIFSKSH